MLATLCFVAVVTFTAAAGIAATPTAALTQQSKNLDSCLNKANAFSAEARIAGCTALIQNNLPKKYLAYAFNNRGLAFETKHDYERAIADFTDAIRLEPKFAHALYNRGTAYQAKGDYDRAIADYTAAIQLEPANFRAYKNRGLAFQTKGDNLRADSDLNEASRLKPDKPRP